MLSQLTATNGRYNLRSFQFRSLCTDEGSDNDIVNLAILLNPKVKGFR